MTQFFVVIINHNKKLKKQWVGPWMKALFSPTQNGEQQWMIHKNYLQIYYFKTEGYSASHVVAKEDTRVVIWIHV